MDFIRSKENPRLKAVRTLLRSRSERERTGLFVMEGRRALDALLDNLAGAVSVQLREIWVSDQIPPDAVARYEQAGVPLAGIPHALMEPLSDCRTSQGVLCVLSYVQTPWVLDPETGCYLLLDGISDPGNLGTLIRSAVAFGLAGVFLHGGTMELLNPKAVRATMGSLPFCRCWRTDHGLFPLLQSAGYEVLATVVRDGEPLSAIRVCEKTVLAVGGEAHGLSREVMGLADRRVSIPMRGPVESLNAAVAGSICMAMLMSLRNANPSSSHLV